MTLKHTLLFLLLGLFLGCKSSSCYKAVYCNITEIPAFAGFSHSDLDSVTFNVYNADSTFSSPLYSITIYDSCLYETSVGYAHPWTGISLGYPNSDTLVFAGYISKFFDYVDQAGDNFIPHDWEIIIWNLNMTYRFSNIRFTGNTTEKLYACDSRGDPKNPGSCTKMLTSYILNGVAVSIPKSDMDFYLFIPK